MRLLIVGSYCPNFRVIRACLAEVPHFYHSFDLPYSCPIMLTSFGPNHSFGLRIEESSTEELDLGQIGKGFGLPALVVDRVPSAGPPSPFGKGKSKVSEIRYVTPPTRHRVSSEGLLFFFFFLTYNLYTCIFI